jgi:hypothetical protein
MKLGVVLGPAGAKSKALVGMVKRGAEQTCVAIK